VSVGGLGHLLTGTTGPTGWTGLTPTEEELIDPVSTQSQRTREVGAVRAYHPDTIPALASLLDELARERVHYCLWKSNVRLADGLGGRTDLDMLVDREQAPLFREILDRRRLKPLVAAKGSAYPGIEHFLGLDNISGRLFHLHVHYQLVLGERYVKNYRLPIEREVLGSIRLLEGVPVPQAALELSILAVRALLKYRGRDAVKDILGIRSPGIPPEMQKEIAWLLDQTSVDEVRHVLEASGGPVPVEPVCRFLDLFTEDARSGFTWLRLRGDLRKALGRLERRSRLRASIAYWGAASRRRRWFGRRFPRARMTPMAGGLTVALVGADGSGKSTAVGALERWLGWKVDVRVYYMGSKAPSRQTRWLTVAFRALRRAHRAVSRWRAVGSHAARPIGSLRDMALGLRYLMIGRDRVRRHRAGHKDAQAGRVVIFDRFPLESLSSEDLHRALDGPKISRALGASMGRVTRALARAEERMYRGFGVPDYLIVLGVRPEISAGRKPDHVFEVLEVKSRAALELAALAEQSSDPVGVIRVDANRSLEDVLLEIKRRLWDVL
jgi:thymidylate kinase